MTNFEARFDSFVQNRKFTDSDFENATKLYSMSNNVLCKLMETNVTKIKNDLFLGYENDEVFERIFQNIIIEEVLETKEKHFKLMAKEFAKHAILEKDHHVFVFFNRFLDGATFEDLDGYFRKNKDEMKNIYAIDLALDILVFSAENIKQ